MPRPSAKAGYAAIPVRNGESFSFSDNQRTEIRQKLAKVASDQQCDELIRRLEQQSMWLLPWEQRKVPSIRVRQEGLLRIADMADELAMAIDPNRGLVGADWQNLHLLFLRVDRTQLLDLRRSLTNLAAAAGVRADRCRADKVAAARPMDRLAGIVAYEYYEVLKVMPTIGAGATWQSSPYSSLTVIYANAIRGRLVTWGQVQRSVSSAVKALRDHVGRTSKSEQPGS